MKQEYKCQECGQIFFRYPSQPAKYCSKLCRYKGLSKSIKGKNNPNFNHKWSTDEKEVARQRNIEQMKNPERRYKAGNANRGKRFSKERIDKMHENRTTESYQHYPSEETKRKIGERSKQKWTPEFKAKFRSTMEHNGNWIPLEDKTKIEIYFKMANWPERMWNYITDETQLTLLKTYGVFHNTKNTKGVVRDHIYGRRDGFENGVFPEILRHPCNCQILSHSDNVAKKDKRYLDRSDISLEELFNKIEKFKEIWKEQELVLSLIKDYREGKRYE